MEEEDFLEILEKENPKGCYGYICETCPLGKFNGDKLSGRICSLLNRLGSKYAKDTGR